MNSDEKQALIRHIRRHHPNLLGGAFSAEDYRHALERDEVVGFAGGALPDSGLSEVPLVVLDGVHRAAHLGLYVDHQDNDWLCRHLETA